MKALDYFTILSSSVLIRITIFYYLIFQYQMKALDYSRFLFLPFLYILPSLIQRQRVGSILYVLCNNISMKLTRHLMLQYFKLKLDRYLIFIFNTNLTKKFCPIYKGQKEDLRIMPVQTFNLKIKSRTNSKASSLVLMKKTQE